MSKRERRGDHGRAPASEPAAGDARERERSRTSDGEAADAAARRMAARDDDMVVADSDRDPEQLRIELVQRVIARAASLERAVAKFESILRRRKAEPILKKGLMRAPG